VWSVQFMHSTVLWGAAAGVIPVLFHLLARRRPKMVRFPPVQFVQRGGRKGRIRSHLKHILLMLLRMLIILLAVLAVSRPTLTRRAAGSAHAQQGTEGGAAAVIILDDSLSMNYSRGGSSWFERARNLALQMLEGMGTQTRVGFSTASRPRIKLSPLRPAEQAVASEIAGSRATCTSHSCWRALELAAEALRNERAADRRITIFTDMTRSAWHGFERLPPKLGSGVKLTIVDVSEEAPFNLAVTALRTTGEPAVEGAVIGIEAEVLSVGRAADEPVQMELDGEVMQRRLVKLAPGARERLLFRIPLKGSGHHWGRVAFLTEDPLPQDNARNFALEVAQAISVLCVDERKGTPGASKSYFFGLALNPWRDQGRGTFRVATVTPQELAQASLAGSDVVVLADVRAPDASLWQRLNAFVSGGGGLMVLLGQVAEPRAYTADQARSFLPAEPAEVVEAPQQGLFRLRSVDRQHAIVGGIAKSGADLGKAHFRRCRRLKLSPRGHEVFSFGPDLPALVVSGGTAGRTAVFGSGTDGTWGNLARCPAFVPFCQEIVLWLSRRSGLRFGDFRPGEHVPIQFETSRWPTRVAVRPPGASAPVELLPGATPGRRLFWHTDVPGYYEVRFSRKDRTWRGGFAVNAAPIESDLRRVSAKELKQAIGAERIAFVKASSPSAGLWGQDLAAQPWRGTELTRYLILLALAACVAELFLANRFYRAP